MKKFLLSLFLVLIACSQTMAETSVWKIQKDESVVYLGGTFHILRQSDFPLPAAFEEVYSLSDMLVFETDIGQLSDGLTQQKLISGAIYADGSTVEEHLSTETYGLLSEYCVSNGIPLIQLKLFKPSIIAVTMVAIELSKFGAAQDGVDMFFYQSAKKDNKVIEGLEGIDEQINFILGMGEGNEDAFITYTINDLKTIKQTYEVMVDAWKNGDEEKLYELVIGDVKIKMPRLYKELITDRNEKWLSKIGAYFQTPEKEFILVGVGHLVGPEGIIAVLSQNGYKVEKL